MAFPNPPRTWSAGETLTAANFNAQIRDALLLVPHNIPKSADQSVTSSTAFIDDTHLQFAIGANEGWHFRFVLAFTAATLGQLKVALNAPAGAAGWWQFVLLASASGTLTTGVQAAATFVDGQTSATQVAPGIVYLDGYCLNGATPGTFKLRWAQDTSNGTATVLKKGSWLSRQRD